MRFSTRLILSGIIYVILSLVVAGSAFYLSTRRIILHDIRASQAETARQTMREVDRHLYKAYLDIQGIADDTALENYMESPRRKDLAIVERDLMEKLDLTGPWMNLLIVDLHGRIVAGTSSVLRGRDIRPYGELNTAFESALKGKVFHSDLVRPPELKKPTVIFAAPILGDDDGKVKGVALGGFAWPAVLQLLDEIGPESEVHLLNRAGLIIGTRMIHQEAILRDRHPEHLAAAKSDNPEGDVGIIADDSHKHSDVLVSRADQEGYLGYQGHGWRLFLETRLAYVLGPIHRIAQNLIIIVLLILVVVAAGMYLLGRRLSRPVQALTGQVALLGRGDLSVRAPVESTDELGQLAAAFNRMVEDLGRITVSKEELDNILRTMINSLVVATPEGKIRMVNRAALNLLGYREEELLGQPFGLILEDLEKSPETVTPAKAGVQSFPGSLLSQGQSLDSRLRGNDTRESGGNYGFDIMLAEVIARGAVSNMEKTYRTKEGRLIPVLFSAAVMNASPGGSVDIVCAAQDISDRKALEEGLQKAYDDLKNIQTQLVQTGKLAAIGELAAGVAHELNQPLMVIRGTAQLIERAARKGSLTPEALLTQMEPIDRNTKRMTRIINHLRTFSRQSQMEFQPVEINRVIEESFLLIGEQLKLRDIAVERDLAPDLPKIRADANQLEQVFLNLIANSRDAVTEAREKAAAEGREAKPEGIAIISRLAERGPSPGQAKPVEVLIRDAGCGIPEDKVSRIFDPFFTTKAEGLGTGLGLSISYGIVKDHGGEIEVAATGPEGTTMRLLLPVEG